MLYGKDSLNNACACCSKLSFIIKTIADPILNECVRRNYETSVDTTDMLSNEANIPLLMIPSAEPLIRNADDWEARFEVVRGTFSSRVGQICNAALDRSIIAYNENSNAEERRRFREETEVLELGPLRLTEAELPADLLDRLEQVRPEKMPSNVLPTLVAYYLANRPEDSNWVVLPVTNFDCYFGNTNFGRKYLNQLPQEVIERGSSFGVSRYRVREEYLPE